MDRRSLELNFENNLLFFDPALTETIRQRQLGYLSQSTPVEAEAVNAKPFRARLYDDAIGMASPLL
jgi:cardiolipin synthase